MIEERDKQVVTAPKGRIEAKADLYRPPYHVKDLADIGTWSERTLDVPLPGLMATSEHQEEAHTEAMAKLYFRLHMRCISSRMKYSLGRHWLSPKPNW